jgi:hypothetical protein
MTLPKDEDPLKAQLRKRILAYFLEMDDKGRFIHAPRNDDELYEFIVLAYGIRLPRKVITPGHKAPFSFVANLFFERAKNVLAFASRNGGKTFSVALLNHLDMLFKSGCEIASAGAVRDQADKCYRYYQSFLELPWFKEVCEKFERITGKPLLVDSIKSKTTFSPTMDRTKGSLLEIITGTETGLRGPHPNKARIDEVDLVDWSVLQTALSMAHSSDGIRGQNVFTSTRQLQDGSMQRLLDESTAKGIDVYEWDIWEVVEKCERRCIDDPKEGTCPIYTFCKGRAHHCAGFYKIDDFIDKVRLLDRETFETEWENKRPSRHKMVYSSFQHSKHIMTPERLVQMCGAEYPLMNWQKLSGLDFGSSPGHPFVYLKLCQLPTGQWLIFNEYVAEQRLMRDHAASIKRSPFYYPGEIIYADWDAQDRLELQDLGVRTRQAIKGPQTITMGIDFIKTLLNGFPPLEEPQIFVWHDCIHTIREFGVYQWPVRSDGKVDRTGTPVKDNDHCFVAGTLVLTKRGEVPIESVTSGDFVLTRQGWKKVLASGVTSESAACFEYQMPNGKSLQCTMNHPIFTENRGFIPASSLSKDDQIVLWKNANSVELLSGDTQIPNTLRIETISDAVRTDALQERSIYTEQFGDISTIKKSNAVGTYITLTEILSITNWKIWNVLKVRSIYRSTLGKANSLARNSTKRTFLLPVKKLLLGTLHQKVGSGIRSTLKLLQKTGRRLVSCVSFVKNRSKLRTRQPSFVLTSAKRQTDENSERIKLQKTALFAEQNSSQIDSQVFYLVVEPVPQNLGGRSVGQHKVYNLTVEDCPEFFANGVLVHNCLDALRYALYSYKRQGLTRYWARNVRGI